MNSFKEYFSYIVKKSVNTVTFHSSKFYFLKFFFERNNKHKNLEIKKNYIFSNSKWTNYYASSLNNNHMRLFWFLFIVSFLGFISVWTNLVPMALVTEIFNAFLFHFNVYWERLTVYVYRIYLFSVDFLLTQLFGENYPLIINSETSIPIELLNDLRIQKIFNTLTVAQNDFYNLMMVKKLFQFVEYPPIEALDMRTWNYPKTYSTKAILSLTDVEFANLKRIEDRDIFYSNNTAKIHAYKLNVMNLKRPELNHLNSKLILNLYKEDRWLIKNFIIENNSIFKLNQISHYISEFNTYFSSHAWNMKKFYFFNQLKYNLYTVNSMNANNLLINDTAVSLYHLLSNNLRYSLQGLNSLYLTNDEYFTKYESALNYKLMHENLPKINLNLVMMDVLVEEGLFFYSKLISNYSNQTNLNFYNPNYTALKSSCKVRFLNN
uniref:Uncharacterized protein n=1 Tax=Strombidium sp. TaxID=181122 RepID=A0A7T0Q5R9_9SPIT|nr:hypothetical protein [Strombidium sp.]